MKRPFGEHFRPNTLFGYCFLEYRQNVKFGNSCTLSLWNNGIAGSRHHDISVKITTHPISPDTFVLGLRQFQAIRMENEKGRDDLSLPSIFLFMPRVFSCVDPTSDLRDQQSLPGAE